MRSAIVRLDDGHKMECAVPDSLAISSGNECIVDDSGVLEHGVSEVVRESAPAPGCAATVVRRATLHDQSRERENVIMGKMAMQKCRELVAKHKLDMRLIRVRYSFDRTVLKVLFSAEERVDFRQMLKDLAGEFKVRVEIKQIGVRDEAGMLGGLAGCGRQMCCCSWLKRFESINVKMAKVQKIPLNPATISGMCGRLKCCLRYEYETYSDLAERMPRDGTRVKCPGGGGCVVDRDILGRKVRVRMDDERIMTFSVEEVGSA